MEEKMIIVGLISSLQCVENEVKSQAGLFLVLLDVELVAASEDTPVDVAGVHARGILAVLGELDREPLVGRPVHAAEEPLDRCARGEPQVFQTTQRGRVEVAVRLDLRHGNRSGRRNRWVTYA